MNRARSLLIFTFCFTAGAAASLGWRMNHVRSASAVRAVEMKQEGRAKPGKAEVDAGTTGVEKRVFGRSESIEGLAKALATADAKQIDEWSKRLAVTDAFYACEMLAAAPKSEGRDKAFRHAIIKAALLDPFRAYSYLSEWKQSGTIDDTRRTVIRKMAEKEPKLAWDTLSQAGGISKGDLEQVADVWGSTQGYAAATFGTALRDPIQRSVFLRKALSQWVAEDIASFSKWFAQQPAEAGLERFVNFDAFEGSVHKPPSLSMLDAAVTLNLSVRSSSMNNLFERAWSSPDMREQAAAWISAQKDPEVRDAAWKELALAWTKTDLARARETLPLIADPKQSVNVSSTIAAEMAKMTPQEAMQFAKGLNDEGRAKAQASAVVTWSKYQPAESLAYVRAHPEELGSEFLSVATAQWIKHDGAATLALVDEMSPGKEGEWLIKSLASQWLQSRPDELNAWLATAPSGRTKDAVMAAKAEPAKSKPYGGASWSGPNGEIHMNYGGPGESSTTATVGGRTIKYVY